MRRTFLILLALAVVTVAAFWEVGLCEFVGYDDPSYVRFNPMVNQGLREAAICWAFSATHGANWHPITSLSHMLDCSLFDLNPAPMHWENVLWHLLNAVLVVLLGRRMAAMGAAGNGEPGARAADATWPSALVAALFAWHPLHVESVAWISERKDVLSTALWLLTILAYVHWVQRPSRGRYALVALGLVLALMAKPMTITLPCTLLLLDYWPLRRWPQRSWGALFREKLPLFGLVLALCVVTILVQRALGANDYGVKFTLWMRLANAAVSYSRYLGKTLWPATLSPFYPHPGSWPWWAVLGAFTLVGALSWLAWRERERRPWLLFGWCWYLGTLVPAIGVIQVGAQSIADRYTYVPLLGIFTIVAWAGAECIARRPALRAPLAVAAGLALAACVVRTFAQVPVWRNGIGLIEHMRSAIGEHEIVYREMGMAYLIAGRPREEAVAQYRRGHEVAPDYAYFINEIASNLAQQKRYEEARATHARILELLPNDPAAYANYGSIFAQEGNLEEAERQIRRALEISPRLGGIHRLLGEIQLRQDRKEEGCESLRTATRCDRWDWAAYNQLGIALAGLGRYSDSLAAIERALWINPGEPGIAHNLDYLKKQMGLAR